jgi:dTDP-4-amino-4,6-dideoxygalactose transaminase
MITPRTTGIIGVHLWGRPCNVLALTEIARRRRLRLLFDAAHAFGCTALGRPIGTFGDAEVFSFHATKFVNAFEGGAVATNDDDLAARIRLMKNFGFSGYDNVIYIGTNGKMSEASAAMALTSLESVHEFVDINRANHACYSRALSGLPGLKLLGYDSVERSNYQYVVVEVDAAEAGLSRDAMLEVLHAENVIARRYFYPGCHRMEPYRSYFPHAGMLLPHTDEVARRVLVLPTGTSVGEREIGTIASLLADAMSDPLAVRAAAKRRPR